MSFRQYITPEEIQRLLKLPAVAQFMYYLVVITTGYLFLHLSIRDGIVFDRGLLYMFVWFLLMIGLQPPEGARFESRPFEDVEIIADQPAK